MSDSEILADSPSMYLNIRTVAVSVLIAICTNRIYVATASGSPNGTPTHFHGEVTAATDDNQPPFVAPVDLAVGTPLTLRSVYREFLVPSDPATLRLIGKFDIGPEWTVVLKADSLTPNEAGDPTIKLRVSAHMPNQVQRTNEISMADGQTVKLGETFDDGKTLTITTKLARQP